MHCHQARAMTSENTFFLNLEVPLAGFYHDMISDDSDSETANYFSGGIGGGRPFFTGGELFSIMPRIELGLGRVMSRHIIVGVRLQFTFVSGTYPYDVPGIASSKMKLKSAYLGFLPFFELTRSRNKRFVPFLLMSCGVRGEFARMESKNGPDFKLDQQVSRGVAALGGGTHIFPGDHFSIDLTLSFTMEMGRFSFETNTRDPYSYPPRYSPDVSKGFVVRVAGSLALGLSAWF